MDIIFDRSLSARYLGMDYSTHSPIQKKTDRQSRTPLLRSDEVEVNRDYLACLDLA